MSFSIKQLLVFIAFAAVGLVSLANANKPIFPKLVDLIALATLVFMAYGIWLQKGEVRAFKSGFVLWSVVYFRLYKQTFDIGIDRVLEIMAATSWKMQTASNSEKSELTFATEQLSPRDVWEYSTYAMGHSMLMRLFGLIGGWTTVYLYRKRQKMQAKRS